MRRICAFALVAGVVALTAAPASAHALLRRSDPANGAVLAAPPDHVTIEFTERPDPSVSAIRLVDSGGGAVATGPTRAVPGDTRALTVAVTATLPNDVYTVTWRTVSREDGHVTGGSFAFGVGKVPNVAADAPAPRGTAQRPSPIAVTGRWLLYAGLALLIGAALTARVVLRAPLPRRGPLVGGGVAVVAGSVAAVLAEQHAVGTSLGSYLRTGHGRLLAAQTVACVVAAVATALPRRVAPYAAALVALAAMTIHADASHAGAAAHLRLPTIGVQWVHLLAVTCWLGALAWALLALPPDPAAARRLSRLATVCALVVVTTGTVRTVAEVSTWHLLWSTGFGRTVLAKVAVFAALLALGARNRFRLVPAASTRTPALRRTIGAEVVFGGIAFALTGLLAGLAPARLVTTPATSGPRPVVVTGNDFATTTRVALTVTPGGVGANTFTAAVRDYDSGAPVDARRVALRFSLPARPDLRTSTLELTRRGDDWTGTGPNLSVDAPWHVVVVVEGANSVEVPLTVTPALPPQMLHADVQPGQATIYTATLPDGSSVQTYLDPDVAGFTEVHVTVFDAKGTEQRVDALQVTVTSGEKFAATTVRRFGPGHFAADTTLAAGRWHVAFRAVTATGAVLRGYADVDVRQKGSG